MAKTTGLGSSTLDSEPRLRDSHPVINKAFILGAGLGTRLRPLTEVCPKPLVPIWHEPMANHALRHCQNAGIDHFAINTHHLPEKWHETYPEDSFNGSSLQFFHEPTLLDTGGGLRNITHFIGSDPILVYNGDILTDIDIRRLIRQHEQSNNLATLALRSSGDNCNVNISGEQVTDMRNLLATTPGTHQFTGIYCINPGILDLIPEGEVVSIVPAFIELIQRQQLGAVVLDEGDWCDIGTPEAYRAVHQKLRNTHPDPIHPEAIIHPDATIDSCIIGPGAKIGAHARLQNCIVWPGVHVPSERSASDSILCH
ncbi:NTP transferase domain-containing protein [Verrucomicrobiaceae bacterium N1E253]|uniref:NTP transferase domain-containing protein n=1 Tax=Oceaniferula marina TaxID=2748318 RepID=A0A851GEN4_9BACT|nr:sugar phosphate nucleotidyltransferase [Oceaniferula marina]NWK56218.1 NTP transferase domain-containing protein [Oceaniferula marina]